MPFLCHCEKRSDEAIFFCRRKNRLPRSLWSLACLAGRQAMTLSLRFAIVPNDEAIRIFYAPVASAKGGPAKDLWRAINKEPTGIIKNLLRL